MIILYFEFWKFIFDWGKWVFSVVINLFFFNKVNEEIDFLFECEKLISVLSHFWFEVLFDKSSLLFFCSPIPLILVGV